jgi:glyoxylase-like metal-dependent hydrolase (beta-lactamase superfamily II)
MIKIHHINCGTLQRDEQSLKVICHCLLLEHKSGLALVDTGIGMQDIENPKQRVGEIAIENAGFKFNKEHTAVSQIEALGLNPSHVLHCIISHMDPDHIGGLADFPEAVIHVSAQEYKIFYEDNPRFRTIQMSHNPVVQTYTDFTENWFGLVAAKLDIGFETDMYLLPLPGHTLGQCGVAIRHNDQWILYVADAYYLKDELFVGNHPVTPLSEMSAMDNNLRIRTLEKLKLLASEHSNEIIMYGYHDPSEFPRTI